MASWPQGSAIGAHPGDVDLDLAPIPHWDDGATNYLIRFHLPGFKKEEFRVLVDRGGRLTLRGQRSAGVVRVQRTLQLPPTADVDRIAARFDGRVLCLTLPKVSLRTADMARARMDEAKEVAAAWDMEVTRDKERSRSEWDKGQLIAATVAAFVLGVVVTHRFFSARNV
ncbi:21.9 kDa heat shock protein [Brachypodium distachyon]|uniref:SHSP domain-containing protein n=1 Tax=Brachypodium distachyon TaxID=15368 RepID=I1HNY6_BRADI|nr:21.9 kDa heat shock protein [Brachypodium distachyon]KQK08479.1 hypothetical protein BRADI_2g42120v3 [Brachypodium distachyon]|eukprot:XP_003566821.1 21.9 kDa heat shock protein [Brachypodium distachyon]